MLNRTSVTVASRIMLPAYVVLSTAFGVDYLFDPLGRVEHQSALTYQRSVMDMRIWGALLLLLAFGMIVALVVHSRSSFVVALAVCASVWFVWGCLYVISAVQDPGASPLAPVVAWFVSVCCLASMASLMSGEVR